MANNGQKGADIVQRVMDAHALVGTITLHFEIEGAVFSRFGPQRRDDYGAYGVYTLVTWSRAFNEEGFILGWANFIPIKSTLYRIGPDSYTGGFVQNGRTGGIGLHPPMP